MCSDELQNRTTPDIEYCNFIRQNSHKDLAAVILGGGVDWSSKYRKGPSSHPIPEIQFNCCLPIKGGDWWYDSSTNSNTF